MTLDMVRVAAVVRKELREYRRNRFILGTMIVTPMVFMVSPTANLFTIPTTLAHSTTNTRVGLSLLFLLLIPVILPATIAASSVVGERQQGTLEPVLTTPIRREELLIGKAVAALVPSVGIAYAVFALFLAGVKAFANPVVASAVLQGPRLLAQLLFIPLLAAWAIWAGLAISVHASDVRVAQQLGTVASLPPVAVTSLMAFGVIEPTFAVALLFAFGLLAIDVMAWRVISPMFDRERLITGIKRHRSQEFTSPRTADLDAEGVRRGGGASA
jgi:ABC-2 type transport system permease protein